MPVTASNPNTAVPVLPASPKRLNARFAATALAAIAAVLSGLPTILPSLKALMPPALYEKTAAVCGIVGFLWLAVQRGMEAGPNQTHDVDNSANAFAQIVGKTDGNTTGTGADAEPTPAA